MTPAKADAAVKIEDGKDGGGGMLRWDRGFYGDKMVVGRGVSELFFFGGIAGLNQVIQIGNFSQETVEADSTRQRLFEKQGLSR